MSFKISNLVTPNYFCSCENMSFTDKVQFLDHCRQAHDFVKSNEAVAAVGQVAIPSLFSSCDDQLPLLPPPLPATYATPIDRPIRENEKFNLLAPCGKQLYTVNGFIEHIIRSHPFEGMVASIYRCHCGVGHVVSENFRKHLLRHNLDTSSKIDLDYSIYRNKKWEPFPAPAESKCMSRCELLRAQLPPQLPVTSKCNAKKRKARE